MTVVLPVPTEGRRPASRDRALARHPLVLMLCIVVLATALRLSAGVGCDVSWQLWVADRISHGARLYRDISEVNPPLWFWLAIPVDRVAGLLHLRSEIVLLVAINGLALASLAACARLLAPLAAPRRSLVLAYLALLLTIMPWPEAGQREHLALIGALPYALLIAARRDGRAVAPLLAFAVGLGAGVGFALKPYFLLAPAMLEAALIIRQRRDWRPLRPETMAMAAIGIVYAIGLIALAPDYLRSTLPMVLLAYGKTGAPRFADLIRPEVLVGTFAAMFAIVATRQQKGQTDSGPRLLVLAALAFLAAYFVQAKGWAYHAIPLLGCGCAALALASLAATRLSRPILIASPALLVCPFAMAAESAIWSPQPSEDLRAAVSTLPPGASVGILATDPALTWPLAYRRQLVPASRYMHFWMMRAVVDNELRGNPDPRVAKFGRQVVAETVEDFVCAQPKLIIAARPRPGEDGFDIFKFFLRDPAFVTLLTHYRHVSRTSVDSYQLASPLPRAARGRACASKGLVFP